MMSRFGWRTLYLGGLAVMLPIMALVGFLDLGAGKDPNVRWAQSALLLVWFFCYGTYRSLHLNFENICML